ADLAVDRGAGRRHDPVCLLELAGADQPDPSGSAVEEPLAGGARLPADEGGTGPESFRGSVVAGGAPPPLPRDVGLWILGVGTTPREGGPGLAGDQKGGRAADHAAGHRAGVAGVVEADGQARLPLLQPAYSCFRPGSVFLNGVVLTKRELWSAWPD